MLTVTHIALSPLVVVDDPVQLRMTLFHSSMDSIDLDMDFSDPKTYFTLAFPSPLMARHERFDSLPDTNTVLRFQHMGRSTFKDVLRAVPHPHFFNGYTPSTFLKVCMNA